MERFAKIEKNKKNKEKIMHIKVHKIYEGLHGTYLYIPDNRSEQIFSKI